MGFPMMPGCGDAATWGPITSPRDPRWTGDDAAEEEALAVIVEHVFEERMQSAAWVSDAQGDFTNAEYDAITAALVAGDAMEVGRLTLEATRASIRRGAEKEAPHRLAKLVREDERDYADMRMEH